MVGRIETACLHFYGGREIIYCSNKESDWMNSISDIRSCYGKIFGKESGSSIVMLSPIRTGIVLIISKMIPNRFGDNISAYLHIPYGLDVNGNFLKNATFDIISALAQNRKDTISDCLKSISQTEFDFVEDFSFDSSSFGDKLAFRNVSSEPCTGRVSLNQVYENIFQNYYTDYKYIYLPIDNQHVANSDDFDDLSNCLINNWRPVKKKESEFIVSDDSQTVDEINVSSNRICQDNNSGATFKYTREWLKNNTEIHGWLVFFCIALVIGGIASAIYPIATYNAEDYSNVFSLAAGDIITGLFLFAISIYTVALFVQRKPNAVFWGVAYVSLVLLTKSLEFICGLVYDYNDNIFDLIKGSVWSIIWLLYLMCSQQVATVIPELYRKVHALDWLVLAIAIVVPMTFYIVGFSELNALTLHLEEDTISNAVLEDDERTDGRIIFTIPEEFTCNSQIIDNVELFRLESPYAYCTLCSDYDNDRSDSNFEEYRTIFEDSQSNQYVMSYVNDGELTINGNYCMYKVVKYDVGGVFLYWRYYLMFNDETGKIFSASIYDNNTYNGYIIELLKSVRFK